MSVFAQYKGIRCSAANRTPLQTEYRYHRSIARWSFFRGQSRQRYQSADTEKRKIHVKAFWSKWFGSARRQLVRRSVLEGCCGPRKEAASARENLPDLRFRQPLSNRTETQGQGNNRGQRGGYRGIL